MRFSIEWLKKFVAVKDSADTLGAHITGAGLEVESIEDNVMELKVPPNRADCLGMVGLAREVAAVTKQKFVEPIVNTVAVKIQDKVNVQVRDAKACPKYLGRVIKGIDSTRETPQWIKDCLTNAQMKVISPVVDITNFVLLEWGQPLHAFDMRKIAGDIVVRRATSGEELVLLDDSLVKLTPDTLVVADSNKPLAIAGVKGGKDSGIEVDTTDILLECAYFDPVSVRLTSRHFGLKTDGAYRFERCIDPSMQEKVMEHVTQLIIDTVGGIAGPVVGYTSAENLPTTTVLSIRIARIKRILGVDIDKLTVTNILQSLGFQVETHNGDDELMITVPAFRPDIIREIDLIEEVARIYGLDNIKAQDITSTLTFAPLPEAKVSEAQVLSCLANRDYHEVITYSFIDAEYAKNFFVFINPEMQLANPISQEMGYMRPSLWPGLVKTIQYNQNRQLERIRVFEIGLRFNGTAQNPLQTKTIAGACYGNHLPEGWGNPKRLADIFDVKADVLALLKLSHNVEHIRFKQEIENKALHPGQAMNIYIHDKLVGKIGVLHPQIQQSLGLPNPVVMFELDYDLVTSGNVVHFDTFSKMPSVRRDIAVLVDKNIAAGNLLHAIRMEAGSLLTEVVLFDVYQGKGVPEQQKSMALGLTMQHPDRTLTDTEVQDIYTNVINMLQREFSAVLR